MDIIGQNGNEGEHYEEEERLEVKPPPKSKKTSEEKKKIIRQVLEYRGGWNGNTDVTEERVNEAFKRLSDEDDELTIKY